MTTEEISFLSLSVSLLSALIAAWSLREAKEARHENKNLKLSIRKTDLSGRLSDATSFGHKVLDKIGECFELIDEKELIQNDELQNDIKYLIDKKKKIENKMLECDVLKSEYVENQSLVVSGIEVQMAAAYKQMKAWESDFEKVKKILEKIKKLSGPSIYEKRGILSF